MATRGRPRGRPATTPEGREAQLIALAVDTAEKQMVEGTASAQVITHFLKLATVKEKLEQERLRQENALLQAKIEREASSKRIEDLYEQALNAMREYSGNEVQEDDDYDY